LAFFPLSLLWHSQNAFFPVFRHLLEFQLTPDSLHQQYQGLAKHELLWIKRLLKEAHSKPDYNGIACD
jgi:hypothetical protein